MFMSGLHQHILMRLEEPELQSMAHFSRFECNFCYRSNSLRFIFTSLQLVLCRVEAVKASPYIIHSADYILFQSFEIRGYIMNNQEILIGLDSCFRSCFFILWVSFDIIQSLNRLPSQI